MPNLVPSTGGTAVGAHTGGANPWAEAARGVDTGAYLKFNGNDGVWSFGQDDTELPCVYTGLGAPKLEEQDPGSRVVADMQSYAQGFICWVDSNVEEEVLVNVMEGRPPQEHTLTDFGPYNDDDGWREAMSIGFVLESFGGDDQDEAVGTQMLWKSSTGGQVRQVKKLSGAYGRLFAQHPGEMPVVELGAEGYAPKNKKHGKVKYSPTLKIVGWMSAAELEGLTGGAGDDDDFEEPPVSATKRIAAAPEPEAPAPRGRRAAAPVEADEPEEEVAPAPRGRRAAAPVEADEPEEEVAPAPRGRRAAPAAVEADEPDEDVAPAPRGRRRPAPAAAAEPEEAEEPAPAPRGRRAAAAPVEANEPEAEAPAPRAVARGGRGAPPANARLRRFD